MFQSNYTKSDFAYTILYKGATIFVTSLYILELEYHLPGTLVDNQSIMLAVFGKGPFSPPVMNKRTEQYSTSGHHFR